MWRADLLRQPLNAELLADIERVVSAERSRAQVVAPDTHDEAEEDDVEVDDYEGAADASAAPLFLGDGRRPGRVRAQVVQHNVGQFLLSTTDIDELHSSRIIKSRRIQALQGIVTHACRHQRFLSIDWRLEIIMQDNTPQFPSPVSSTCAYGTNEGLKAP